MNIILFWLQIIVSILLIALILLQNRGSMLGAGFGGSGESYFTKRGLEKKIFFLTTITAGIFILLGLLNILIS